MDRTEVDLVHDLASNLASFDDFAAKGIDDQPFIRQHHRTELVFGFDVFELFLDDFATIQAHVPGNAIFHGMVTSSNSIKSLYSI
jgi:deoxyribodipyrimidine photolyase